MQVYRSLSLTESSSICATQIAPHNCVLCIDFDGTVANNIIMLLLSQIKKTFPWLVSRVSLSNKKINIVSTDDEIPYTYSVINNFSDFDRILEKEINCPFDLLGSSLIRFSYIKLENTNKFLITLHHLVCDGISLSYFVGFIFETIESLSRGLSPISDQQYQFLKIEDLIDLNSIKHHKINIKRTFENNERYGFLPAYTKVITTTIKKPKISGITNALLAAAGLALRNFLENDDIKFVIPVNLRPYAKTKISNFSLGFYSSWIDFNIEIHEGHEIELLMMDFQKKIQNSLDKNEHLSNLFSLKDSVYGRQTSGIIKNILTSDSPSICVSNLGKINIRTSYLDDALRLKSVNFGLTSYYRADDCFLLLASGLGEDINLSFLYSTPYMSEEKAKKTMRLISCLLESIFEPERNLICNYIN